MEKCIDEILTNDFDIVKHIYYCVYQIIYNITVILYEFDFYYERDNLSFISDNFKNFKNFSIITIDNKNVLLCNDDKYYRENNILYLEMENKTYWFNKNIYYVKSGENILEDSNKIFKSVNERYFSEFNVIKILNSMAKILNKFIVYKKYVSVSANKIQFVNECGYKIINLNFFFYLNGESFYVKDIWEIIQNNKKENMMKIGMNLMYLYREFSSVNIKIKTNNFNKKTII